MTDPDRRDADSGHVEWHTAPPTEIFPTDLEKGMGIVLEREGGREGGEPNEMEEGTGGRRCLPFGAFNDQTNSALTFYFYCPLYDGRRDRQDTIKFRTTSP